MIRKKPSLNGFSNSYSTSDILSVTIAWHKERLTDFLNRFDKLPKMYMGSEDAAVSLAGAGIVARLDANGESRFAEIRKKSALLFSRIKPVPKGENTLMPRLIGGFSFRPNGIPDEPWFDFPDATFVLPAYMLIMVDGKLWLTVNRAVAVDGDLDDCITKIHEDIEDLRLNTGWEKGNLPAPQPDNEINNVLSQEVWEDMISNAVGRIRKGDLEKVVLARVCRVKSVRQFELSRSLEMLENNYPGCFRFWLEFIPGHAFFGAPPERLIKLHGLEFDTVALAGSIGTGETPKEDQQLATTLLNSIKDRHEHRLVVEDIKTRLHQFASEVDIPDRPNVFHLSNIQHLRTNISGTLKNGYSILDVVEGLHPTAALGGFPRKNALQLIKELENQDRGWYGAPIGWFDSNGDGEFVVAIRSGIVAGNEAWLYSGAGIVADSDPASEWEESQIKLKPMLTALGVE